MGLAVLMDIQLSAYYTLILAVLVLLVGKFLVKHIRFLRDFNIPEPVAGGLVAALLSYGLFLTTGYRLSVDGSVQTVFMLVFFSSIGLSANFAKLRAGGSSLIVFLLVIVVFIVVQNAVGVSLASLLGLDPMVGLITGSITLVGGHGTAGAWADVLEHQYGVQGALTLGIACATFGLIIGGLIGGPVAKWLIQRNNLVGPTGHSSDAVDATTPNFELDRKSVV